MLSYLSKKNRGPIEKTGIEAPNLLGEEEQRCYLQMWVALLKSLLLEVDRKMAATRCQRHVTSLPVLPTKGGSKWNHRPGEEVTAATNLATIHT